jgi:hypothetical protein
MFFLAGIEKIFKYNNTFEDFTYNALTYDINNFDITYMFLSTVISKVIYKKNQLLVMSLVHSVISIV